VTGAFLFGGLRHQYALTPRKGFPELKLAVDLLKSRLHRRRATPVGFFGA